MSEAHPFVRSALSRFDRRAAYLAPAHVPYLAADLQAAAGADPDRAREAFERRKAEAVAHYGLPPGAQSKPFAFSGGVAIVPVTGTLMNRFSQSWGSVTGYNFIRAQVQAAAADPEVSAIVLDVNSPGGMCAGCRELSDDIFTAREQKPTLAVVDHLGASAAYMLASSASKVFAAPTADVGSIGVVAMHVSLAGVFEDFGIKVSLIHAGKHKVDGNPFEDLPDDVRADIQADVDAHYEMFVEAVARNRGLDPKKVRDTEARIYRANDALALGLIDAVEPPAKAVASFLAGLSGSRSTRGGIMSEQQKPENPATETTTQIDAAAVRAEERGRIKAILGGESAKGRRTLAEHLALETEMAPEAANALLEKAPKEAAEQPGPKGSPFMDAMDKTKHPNVGAEGGGASGDGEMSPAQRILMAQAAATGRKPADVTKH